VLGDGNDQGHFGFDRLDDGVGGELSGNKCRACIGLDLTDCLADGAEDWKIGKACIGVLA
jgi:hypothetical protein